MNDDVKIALTLTRHEEAWWIINQSTEYCCTVNDQIIEPYHRMRLNEGDLIEWGLSSGVLFVAIHPSRSARRKDDIADCRFAGNDDRISGSGLVQAAAADVAKSVRYHSGSWHIRRRRPGNREPLTRLYQEYREALLSPGQDIQRRADPFPFNGEAATQDLASLRDPTAEAGTLQDMVTGGLSIDAILDVLDATGEGETARLLKRRPRISCTCFPRNTRRKRRITPFCPI